MEEYETWSSLHSILTKLETNLGCPAKKQPKKENSHKADNTRRHIKKKPSPCSRWKRKNQDDSSTKATPVPYNESDSEKNSDNSHSSDSSSSEDEGHGVGALRIPDGESRDAGVEIVEVVSEEGSGEFVGSPRSDDGEEPNQVEGGRNFQLSSRRFQGLHNLGPHTGMKKKI